MHISNPSQSRRDQQAQNASNILRYFDLAAPITMKMKGAISARSCWPAAMTSWRNAPTHSCNSIKTWPDNNCAPYCKPCNKTAHPIWPCMQGMIDAFVALYQAHIALEEQIAFPACFASMTTEMPAEAGNEMPARHGITRHTL